MRRKSINISLAYCEHHVDSSLQTDLILYDAFRSTRRIHPRYVCKDLPYYMLAHIVGQCVEAMQEIDNRVKKEITDLKDKVNDL